MDTKHLCTKCGSATFLSERAALTHAENNCRGGGVAGSVEVPAHAQYPFTEYLRAAGRQAGAPASINPLVGKVIRAKCERDGVQFDAKVFSYPTGSARASRTTDKNGDCFVNCPECGRSYHHYDNGEELEDLGEVGKTGWWSDRKLTVMGFVTRSKSWPQEKTKQPSTATVRRWDSEGVARATDGCRVELDGTCPHGHPSWLIRLGLV